MTRKRKLALVGVVVAAVTTAYFLAQSRPTAYLTAYERFRLGMSQEEVERLLPAGETEDVEGAEARLLRDTTKSALGCSFSVVVDWRYANRRNPGH